MGFSTSANCKNFNLSSIRLTKVHFDTVKQCGFKRVPSLTLNLSSNVFNRQLAGLKKFNSMIWFYILSCQFLVKNDGDYSVHMSDLDLLVALPKIEEVHIYSHGPSCIRPTPPKWANQVGKMTKHIYCWCDKQWRICTMSPFTSMIYRVFASVQLQETSILSFNSKNFF